MMNNLDDESDSGFRCRQLYINTIHAILIKFDLLQHFTSVLSILANVIRLVARKLHQLYMSNAQEVAVHDSITIFKGKITASDPEIEGTRILGGLYAARALAYRFGTTLVHGPQLLRRAILCRTFRNRYSFKPLHFPFFFLASNDEFKNLTSICPSWL